jgi:site-specific recombinase XerD
MATHLDEPPRSEHPPTAQAILQVWRADHSISESSAKQYLGWISRFRRYCAQLRLSEVDELTCAGVRRFETWRAHSRASQDDGVGQASPALHALRRVYEVMGALVAPWKPARRRALPASSVLRDYAVDLAQHRGNPEATVHKKLDHIGKLLDHLAASDKSWRQMHLPDIDAFLIQCAHGYSRATTADIASTVRSFARFLLASGRINVSGKAAAFFKGGSPVLHNVRVDIGVGGYQTWDRAARSEQVAGQSNCR